MYPSRRRPAEGTFVRTQVEALRRLGAAVDVLAIDGRRSRLAYLLAYPRFWARLVFRRYDVVHAHHPLSALIALAQPRLPVVITHHGLIALRRSRLQAKVSRLVTPRAAAVIASTDEVRSAAGGDALVIPCGVDLTTFVPIPRSDARAALRLDDSEPIVLFVGRRDRLEKRLSLAESVIAIVRRELPRTRLIVLCDVPHHEVPTFMSASDVLLVTSETEGSPTVVKEALACGLPIVSTNVGDVAGLVRGVNGCAITSDDPEALAHEVRAILRRPMRLLSRGHVEHLDDDVIARRVLAVYSTVAARRPHQENARAQPVACVVKHAYFPEHSHVQRNADALVAEGFCVHLVCLRRRGEPRREVIGGITVHRQPVRHHRRGVARSVWEYGAFTACASVSVARLLARRRLRVLEVDAMPDVLALAAVIPRAIGHVPVIFYLMDSVPEHLEVLRSIGSNHVLGRLARLFERMAFLIADCVIVTHHPALNRAIARGLPPHKGRVVLNTADDSVFSSRSVRVPAGDFTIVTHGSILERYGIQVLCDAVELLSHQGIVVTVRVFGEGEYRATLERRVIAAGISDRFDVRGFVPRDELLSELRQAHLGYIGILNNIQFPNKLMEFVALGVPTAVPSWPLFLQYFPSSVVNYFAPGDAAALALVITNVSGDYESALRRATSARELFERDYSWRVQRSKYLATYRALVAPGPPYAAGGANDQGSNPRRRTSGRLTPKAG